MTNFRHAVIFMALTAGSVGAFAQADAEHTQHHPAEPTKKTAKVAAPPSSPSMGKEPMAAMDSKMETMREMHKKMMAAKTPEERKALMADHMKAMQDGMAMMEKMNSSGDMKGMKGMGADAKKGAMSDMMDHHELMEKRMEMMTSMMQMMMDRLPVPVTE